MQRYGQYCPIAKALEQLGEKWTLLIVRDLLHGPARFSDLQRGLPKISSALLAKRLKQLEAAGILRRDSTGNAYGTAYALTAAGVAAAPIVEHLGIWGIRWAERQIRADESDGYVLMEDIRRNLDIEALGTERCAMQIDLRHCGTTQSWWLLVSPVGVDLCDTDPGHEIDVYLDAELEPLIDLWFGRRSLTSLRRADALRVRGRQTFVRSVNRWLGRSPLAGS